MRQQYHSRFVEGRCLVWDVNRLVALAADLPAHEVPVAEIRELDERYWFDGPAPTVRAVAEHARLIGETDLRYPIVLCPGGRVMDGMHRVAKAWLEGRETIRAVRFSEMPAPDYVDVDLGALPYDD